MDLLFLCKYNLYCHDFVVARLFPKPHWGSYQNLSVISWCYCVVLLELTLLFSSSSTSVGFYTLSSLSTNQPPACASLLPAMLLSRLAELRRSNDPVCSLVTRAQPATMLLCTLWTFMTSRNPTSPASTSYPLNRSPYNLHLSDCPLLGPSTNLQAIVVYTVSQPLFSQCKLSRKSIFRPQCIMWRCNYSLSTMKTAFKAGRSPSWPGVCRFQLRTLQFSPLFRHDCHQACWS